MLVLGSGTQGIDQPVAIYNELVVVGACAEGQTDSEKNFSVFSDLTNEAIESLPFFPTTADENFFGQFLLVRFPHEVSFFSGARTVVNVTAL